MKQDLWKAVRTLEGSELSPQSADLLHFCTLFVYAGPSCDWCILESLPPSLWYSDDSNRSVMSLPGTIFPLSVCNVPQWSRNDDVSVHRVSTTAQGLQRGSKWVCVGFVCAVGPAAFAQRRGSAEQNHKTEVLFFIGLAFGDSPSGLVLFKSTMNS